MSDLVNRRLLIRGYKAFSYLKNEIIIIITVNYYYHYLFIIASLSLAQSMLQMCTFNIIQKNKMTDISISRN